MARIKRGTTSLKHRKNVLKQAKGFRWRRSTHERAANEALLKAGTYAYRDRRVKKRTMRKLWIKRLNNAVRLHDLSYSRFINKLAKAGSALDRKILAQIAVEKPEILEKIIAKVK